MKHHKQSHAQVCLGKLHQLFGAELPKVIEELNRELAA
jgi:type I restriction enzyme R subunit